MVVLSMIRRTDLYNVPALSPVYLRLFMNSGSDVVCFPTGVEVKPNAPQRAHALVNLKMASYGDSEIGSKLFRNLMS